MNSRTFNANWRREKANIYNLEEHSTGGTAVALDLWGKSIRAYNNANLSLYSAQECNAACPFCIEKLRPESRGKSLAGQKVRERNEEVYFDNLNCVLSALKPLNVSVSITGGEPSKDPRLPRILECVKRNGMRKRTITTNGSGLLDSRQGTQVLEMLIDAGLDHLNISRAHPGDGRNIEIMKFPESPTAEELSYIAQKANANGCRTRLSCVLLKGITESLDDVVNYLEFARSIGVDNVVFRQLMKTDISRVTPGIIFSETTRVTAEGLLGEISEDKRFAFQNQVLGYYYYVEVWKYKDVDVVVEEADLRFIERQKRLNSDLVYEFVFHPNARLCSTWQPWDGDLGPDLNALPRAA